MIRMEGTVVNWLLLLSLLLIIIGVSLKATEIVFYRTSGFSLNSVSRPRSLRRPRPCGAPTGCPLHLSTAPTRTGWALRENISRTPFTAAKSGIHLCTQSRALM